MADLARRGHALVQTFGDFSSAQETYAIRINHGKTAEQIAYEVSGLCSKFEIRQINLFLSCIRDTDFTNLLPSLKCCTHLTSLNLGGNSITDDGAEELANALPACSELSILNLKLNKISDRGAIALAAILPRFCKLELLDLWGNRIQKKGCDALQAQLSKMPTPFTLDLRHNADKAGDFGRG